MDNATLTQIKQITQLYTTKHQPGRHNQQAHDPYKSAEHEKFAKSLSSQSGDLEEYEDLTKDYPQPSYAIFGTLANLSQAPGKSVDIPQGDLPGKVSVSYNAGESSFVITSHSPDGQEIHSESVRSSGKMSELPLEQVMRQQYALYSVYGKHTVSSSHTYGDIDSEMRGWVETPQIGNARLERLLKTDAGKAYTKDQLRKHFESPESVAYGEYDNFEDWYNNGKVDLYRGEAKQAWNAPEGGNPLKSYSINRQTAERFARGEGSSYEGGGGKGKLYVIRDFPVKKLAGFYMREGMWGTEDEVLVYPKDTRKRERLKNLVDEIPQQGITPIRTPRVTQDTERYQTPDKSQRKPKRKKPKGYDATKGGSYTEYGTEESMKSLIEALKHLQGQHNQADHASKGRGGHAEAKGSSEDSGVPIVTPEVKNRLYKYLEHDVANIKTYPKNSKRITMYFQKPKDSMDKKRDYLERNIDSAVGASQRGGYAGKVKLGVIHESSPSSNARNTGRSWAHVDFED